MSIEKHQLFLFSLQKYQTDISAISSIFNRWANKRAEFSESQLEILFNYSKDSRYTRTPWAQFKLFIEYLYSLKEVIDQLAEDSPERWLIANTWATCILLQNPYTKIPQEFTEFLAGLQLKVSQNSNELQLIAELKANNTEKLATYIAEQKNCGEFIVHLLQQKKDFPELEFNQPFIQQILTKLKQKLLTQTTPTKLSSIQSLFSSGYQFPDEIKTFIELIHRLNTEFSFLDSVFLQSISNEALQAQINPAHEPLTGENEIIGFFQKTQVLYGFCESINNQGMISSIVNERITLLCSAKNNNTYLEIIANHINHLTNQTEIAFVKKFINHAITLLSTAGKDQQLLKFLFECSPSLVEKKTKENVYQQIAKKMTADDYIAFIQAAFPKETIEATDEKNIKRSIASMWEFVNATVPEIVAKLPDNQQRIQLFQTIIKLCEIHGQKVKSLSLVERQNIFTSAEHKNIFAAIKFVARSECSKNKAEFDKIQQQINEFKLPDSINNNIFLLTEIFPSRYSRKIAEIEKEIESIKKNHEAESKKTEKSRTTLETHLQDGLEHLCLEQFAPKMLEEIASGLTSAQQRWNDFSKKVTLLENRINNRVAKLKQKNQTAYQALKTEHTIFLSTDKTKAEQTTQAISTLKTTVPKINQIINDAKLTTSLEQKDIDIALANIDTSVKNKEEQQAKRTELETTVLKEFDDLATLLADDGLTLKVRAEKITALSAKLPEFKRQICQPTDQIEQSLKTAQTKLGEETSIIIQQLKTQINSRRAAEKKISEEKRVNETDQLSRRTQHAVLGGAIGLLRGEVQTIDQAITRMLTQKGEETRKTFSNLATTNWADLNQQKQFIQQVQAKISIINTHIDLMNQYLWWTIFVLFVFETIFRDFFEFEFIKEHKDIREIHGTLDQKKATLLTSKEELEKKQTELEGLDQQRAALVTAWESIESQLKVVQNELTVREETESALKTQLTLVNFDAESHLAAKLPAASTAQHTAFFKDVPAAETTAAPVAATSTQNNPTTTPPIVVVNQELIYS